MGNIYYNPKQFGFALVAEDDPSKSYEFNTIILLRRLSDGMLFIASDSGCSCPTPFADVGVDDLVPATIAEVERWEKESYSGISATNVRKALREAALAAAEGRKG